jgi:hypothetical protein
LAKRQSKNDWVLDNIVDGRVDIRVLVEQVKLNHASGLGQTNDVNVALIRKTAWNVIGSLFISLS